jgi:hypothetical protein
MLLVLASVAPLARHALDYLDVLALLVLALEAKVNPALVAGVGCLFARKGNSGRGLPYNWVAGHWSSTSFGLRPGGCLAMHSGLLLSSLHTYSIALPRLCLWYYSVIYGIILVLYEDEEK